MLAPFDDGPREVSLARRTAAGEADAEAELCRLFAPRIRVWGLRHLGNAQLAHDLVQDVLVIVLEALRAGRVEDPERITGFVLGTCRRVVEDRARTERRRRALLERFPSEAPSEPPCAGADVERMLGCLRALSGRARQVVTMTYFEEQAAPDIARSLGTSAGNVRLLRHRALVTLRDCVQGKRARGAGGAR